MAAAAAAALAAEAAADDGPEEDVLAVGAENVCMDEWPTLFMLVDELR